MRKPPIPPRRIRGTTLVEALIAFLVLSFTVAVLARIHGDLRLGAETARQRADAVRLAEADLEQLRSFATIAASGTARSYADVISASRTIGAAATSPGRVPFTLDRVVRAAAAGTAREVTVVVGWHDSGGRPQRVVLASMIAAADPALGGALALVPTGAPAASAPLP